ncbi:hypothetical protein [Corynebacterium sp. CCM 9204]|uniref:hypothetical protein n=1 Tax=Corynebacterium sp. CCM 9204 TaxID=3057616 RepID=UPI0035265750
MDFRPLVYSPLQNAAIWLAGWIYGKVSYDELTETFTSYGLRHVLCTSDTRGTPQTSEGDFIDILRRLRRISTPLVAHLQPGEPVLRLVFGGPGQVPGLIAGSPSAETARRTGSSALIIRDVDPDTSHILVPDEGFGDPHQVVSWRWFTEHGRVPEPDHLGPGDADRLLANATERVADRITARGFTRSSLIDPRLTVGRLSDFYAGPGLPDSVTPRAGKLLARADRVAAIIESVVTEAGDHSHDAELTELLGHLRRARMAGVAYAVGEYGRGS